MVDSRFEMWLKCAYNDKLPLPKSVYFSFLIHKAGWARSLVHTQHVRETISSHPQKQKEWKMAILEVPCKFTPTTSICYSCSSSLSETTLKIGDWWLLSGPLISDPCFWSGCLLICHKCVSASLRYDLIREQSPLFSSRPISWDGWRGSSVVIFRGALRNLELSLCPVSLPE